ncbi:MAG: site-specific integrase [Acidihalobacter sp.]|uniref:tyrosine-type recombinase/integrase n=1 Tax=Acidihalobacter sp. TaxID=1872108 RepID=UPI00307EAB59
MASISERNGRWRARVRRHGVVTTETFRNKTDAEAWARKQESDVERGLWRDNTEAERTALITCLKRYQNEVTAHKRGAVQEASIIGILKGEALATKAMAKVRSADVSAMVDSWRRDGYAQATIARRLAVLSHVFEHAARSWSMEALANPVRLVKLPPLRNGRERRVSDAEIDAVCKATGSDILPHIVRLAVETAMRRGELVGIQWRDVDLARRVIHIRTTKNGYPRDVPLSSRAVALLEPLKAEHDKKQEEREASTPKETDKEDRLFAVRDDAVTRAFDRAAERARAAYVADCEREGRPADAKHLLNLRFHDLRHEATSRLAALLGVHELAKVTGHRDLRMLMRYYHPSAEDLAAKLG